MALEDYIDKFSHLNMNANGGRKSPHKVCMLLAVMDLIQAGKIHSNRIELDRVLRERFTHYFEQFRQGNDSDKPEQPFFHLSGEDFWHLSYNSGYSKAAVKRYSNKAISHATIDDELFGYMKSLITSPSLVLALRENLSDLPDLFFQWLLDTGRAEKTAKNYTQAIRSTISNWLQESGIISEPLAEYRSYQTFCDLSQKAKSLKSFIDCNKSGNGMYSASLNAYQQFLSELNHVELKSDVQTILEDKKLTKTEKSIMVSARMGQGAFRTDLINMWKGCAVTKYPNTQLLVASHIKPWRVANNAERLDKFNGLLLLANLDKAFDLGFISFEDNGQILISSQLEDPTVLGIDECMAFRVQPEHRKYLDFHRSGPFAQRN